MRKLIGAVVVAGLFAAAGVVGCSSDSAAPAPAGDPCTTTPTKLCSADPDPKAPTADEIKKCQDAAKVCIPETKAFVDCAKANTKCGADNKTDSSAILTACKDQLAAYGKCITPPADGGTDTGGGDDTGGGSDATSD